MYKRPIIMLMILGALMVLVGTGFTANEKTVVASKANQSAINNSGACCEGMPINCETGKLCTPEEMEQCQAICKSMKDCTPEDMEICKNSCDSKMSKANGISTKVNTHKSSCGTNHSSAKVNSAKSPQTTAVASKCSTNKECQPKQCSSKGSI